MSDTSQRLRFGPFELYPQQRLLLERDVPVRLGSRALELLIALAERPGELLARAELESRVWPRTVVEETSLRVHMSALRKALGDGVGQARYIANVPGRGYSFVADVESVGAAGGVAPSAAPAREAGHNLPGRLAHVIGRDEVVAVLADELGRRRLVSLVGAGGMGKTTVAVMVASRVLADQPDGVRFIDLSPLPADSPAAAVVALVAGALGIDAGATDAWTRVAFVLRDLHALLVLDNCEHVIQAAAEVVERLLAIGPRVSVLATSREALDIRSERVHRLAGLQLAEELDASEVDQLGRLSAIQLFVERAGAATGGFELTDANAPHVRDICERLDGMPLAIELAAARVATLGVAGVARGMDEMFDLLTRGRRTAFPRHRTLEALLDWSHDLLDPTEQAVLRRLAVYRGTFSLNAATSLCRDERLDPADVVDALLSLVAKSLVSVERAGDLVRYRLLYTTRTYAERKLAAAGEHLAWRRRHAEHVCERTEALKDVVPSPWTGEIAQMAEDVHAAFAWTLTPEGEVDIGARLAAAVFHLVRRGAVIRSLREMSLALLERVRRLSPPRPELDLQLQTTLLFVLPVSSPQEDHRPLFDRTVELVDEQGDVGDRIEAQYGLCIGAFGRGDHPASMACATRIRELAAGGREDVAVVLGDRLVALNAHYLGDHALAEPLARRVIAHRLAAPVETRFDTFVPRSMSMGSVLARGLWLQGRADEASELCARIAEQCRTAAPVAVAQTMGWAVLPIALWRGDLATAAGEMDLMRDSAEHSANDHWRALARMLERVLRFRQGRIGLESLEPAEFDAGDMGTDLLATLVPSLLSARALERVERGIVGWNAPEVLRAAALPLLADGGPAALRSARSLLARARELATRQGARAWQLRIACSVAALSELEGRPDDGARALEDALAHFPADGQDADLVAARARLAELEGWSLAVGGGAGGAPLSHRFTRSPARRDRSSR